MIEDMKLYGSVVPGKVALTVIIDNMKLCGGVVPGKVALTVPFS